MDNENEGTIITNDMVDACFLDGALKLDAFKKLLVEKRSMKLEKWEKYPATAPINANSSREDVDKCLAKINEKFDALQGQMVKDEVELVSKMAYCTAFMTYCCLCTAFTSCCIGPYFISGYAQQMEDRKEKFDFDLDNAYTSD